MTSVMAGVRDYDAGALCRELLSVVVASVVYRAHVLGQVAVWALDGLTPTGRALVDDGAGAIGALRHVGKAGMARSTPEAWTARQARR